MRRASFALLALLALGCGTDGATKFQGPAPSAEATFGNCAFCHNQIAVHVLPVGADLKCQTCHDDLLPGQVGPGHRAIPGPSRVPSFVGPAHQPGAEGTFGVCAFCHNEFAVNMVPVSMDLKCQNCHADQQPGVFGPGHRVVPGPDKVPSFAGPMHQLGAEAAFGACAFCHNQFAVNMIAVSGDLKCQNCHADQQPGVFGPGHRALPGPDKVPSFVGPTHQLGAEAPFGACAFCHNQFAVSMSAVSSDLKCQNCHADQQPGFFGPGHRSIPGPDLVPSFAGPTHDLGAQAAFGSCAYCHNRFAMNITDAGVDLTCVFCHQSALLPEFGPGHRSIPGPDRVPSFVGPTHKPGAEGQYGSCAFCHNDVTLQATATPQHGTLSITCSFCHTDLEPGEVGPGHRNVPACADCHTQQQTHHDPAAGTLSQCTVCHTPHGSPNLFLIREQIVTPGGAARDIKFNNLLGLADGSFASVSHPGSGVCEVCHTTTQFYRSDGSGAPHFPFACFPCHPHADGFAPR